MESRTIRKPAVAGLFYPDNAGELRAEVERLLDESAVPTCQAPKALIVPHAGYVYSGSVAAAAYALLQPFRNEYSRVVLLGPCHRVALRGLAASPADAFRTPLGDVPVDADAIAGLDQSLVSRLESAHRDEHSLEVHLPFLQAVLAGFSLIPIVVGDTPPEAVARLLDGLWGEGETLIVVSSDLSHYLPYEQAQARDRETCRAIERFRADRIGYQDACGAAPVGGLLIEAQRRGMAVTTLDLRNSGDTAGDRDRVVGYGSWAFC